MNSHHHKVNNVSKHTYTPAIIETINIITHKTGQINHNFQTKITKKNHQPQSQNQAQPQQTFLYIGNLDQKLHEEDLYESFGLKSTKHPSKNSYIDFAMHEQTGKSKGLRICDCSNTYQ